MRLSDDFLQSIFPIPARAVAQIKDKAFAAELDVTNNSRIQEFIQQIISHHKRIDILVRHVIAKLYLQQSKLVDNNLQSLQTMKSGYNYKI